MQGQEVSDVADKLRNARHQIEAIDAGSGSTDEHRKIECFIHPAKLIALLSEAEDEIYRLERYRVGPGLSDW